MLFHKKYGRYVGAAVIAASILIYGGNSSASPPNPRSLADYSDKEITYEYHKRLNAILEQFYPLESQFSAYLIESATSDSGSNTEYMTNEKFTDLFNELSRVTQALIPFADAGDYFAEEYAATGLYGTLGKDKPCRAVKYAIEAGRKGGSNGASTLYFLYEIKVDSMGSQAIPPIVKKRNLWALQAAQRDPRLRERRDLMLNELEVGEREDLIQSWMNWSPDYDTYDELLEICAETE